MASIESEISEHTGHLPLRIWNEYGILEKSTDVSMLEGKVYYVHGNGQDGKKIM